MPAIIPYYRNAVGAKRELSAYKTFSCKPGALMNSDMMSKFLQGLACLPHDSFVSCHFDDLLKKEDGYSFEVV